MIYFSNSRNFETAVWGFEKPKSKSSAGSKPAQREDAVVLDNTSRKLEQAKCRRCADIGLWLGFEPQVQPEEGIPKTINWYRKKGLI